MKQVILFIITYFFVFFIYQILIVMKVKERKEKKERKDRKPKAKKNTKPIEVSILEAKYKIDLEKVNYKKLLLVISLVSSLDITIIITLVLLLDNYFLQLLVALILAVPIILVSYSFIGKYYQKKGLIKDE